eukprot:3186308-Amphidinium_carterae.1
MAFGAGALTVRSAQPTIPRGNASECLYVFFVTPRLAMLPLRVRKQSEVKAKHCVALEHNTSAQAGQDRSGNLE